MSTAWHQLSQGLGDAIADIRQKVVEEPWFGRAVTDGDGTAPQLAQSQEMERGSFSFTSQVERGGQEAPNQEQDLDQGRGISL